MGKEGKEKKAAKGARTKLANMLKLVKAARKSVQAHDNKVKESKQKINKQKGKTPNEKLFEAEQEAVDDAKAAHIKLKMRLKNSQQDYADENGELFALRKKN